MVERFDEINNLLLDYARGKFDTEIQLSGDRSKEDALICAIMMLGEELKANMVSKDYFRQIFNSVSDMIFIMNTEGEILDLNNISRSFFEEKEIQEAEFLDVFKPVWKEITNGLNRFDAQLVLKSEKYHFAVTCGTIVNSLFEGAPYLVVLRDITDQRNIEANLFNTIVSTQEEERSRVAMDLHDSFGQKLAAIKIYSNLIKRKVDTKPEEVDVVLRELEGILDDSISELRYICFNLMPNSFKRLTLGQIIHENFPGTLQHMEDAPQINVRIDGSEPQIPINLKIAVYRITQEFVNNSIKHAQSSAVKILLKYQPNLMRVVLADNGHGFDIKRALSSANGNGIKNIVSRIKAYQGEYEFVSRKREGTTLTMSYNI